MEAFTLGQAARVEAMVKSYEDSLARQKAIINRLKAHVQHHCPKMDNKLRPTPFPVCDFREGTATDE